VIRTVIKTVVKELAGQAREGVKQGLNEFARSTTIDGLQQGKDWFKAAQEQRREQTTSSAGSEGPG
jgi:hypothetical protein